jgi:endonuclease III
VDNRKPAKRQLVALYKKLHKHHPHDLLPLETTLPEKLSAKSRDVYRIILTMILSRGTNDKTLSKNLDQLFRKYKNFKNLERVYRNKNGKRELQKILKDCEFGFNNPDKGGGGGRLWSLLECRFGRTGDKIDKHNIQRLENKHGYGPKFIRCLQAYWGGNKNVLPLDGAAFKALKCLGFYENCDVTTHNIDKARKDIEGELSNNHEISLIDFHEMLRYRGQLQNTSKEKIIIGWNTWRILCSNHRAEINKPRSRLLHFIKDEKMREKLREFYLNELQIGSYR